MIELIEDRDLWRGRFDDAKPFGLWLRAGQMDFEAWKEVSEQPDEAPYELMLEAHAMQRFFDQKVRELVGMARTIRIGGCSVPAVNAPPAFASDVGNALLSKYPDAPFAACYSDQGKQRGFSLRSEKGASTCRRSRSAMVVAGIAIPLVLRCRSYDKPQLGCPSSSLLPIPSV